MLPTCLPAYLHRQPRLLSSLYFPLFFFISTDVEKLLPPRNTIHHQCLQTKTTTTSTSVIEQNIITSSLRNFTETTISYNFAQDDCPQHPDISSPSPFLPCLLIHPTPPFFSHSLTIYLRTLYSSFISSFGMITKYVRGMR